MFSDLYPKKTEFKKLFAIIIAIKIIVFITSTTIACLQCNWFKLNLFNLKINFIAIKIGMQLQHTIHKKSDFEGIRKI